MDTSENKVKYFSPKYKLNAVITMFFVAFFICLFLLYLSGNRFSFLDSTQNVTLFTMSISLIGVFCFCIRGIVLSIRAFVKNKYIISWLYFFFYFMGTILSVVLYLVFRFIIFASFGM